MINKALIANIPDPHTRKVIEELANSAITLEDVKQLLQGASIGFKEVVGEVQLPGEQPRQDIPMHIVFPPGGG